jgi:hypothetical protein
MSTATAVKIEAGESATRIAPLASVELAEEAWR